MKIEIDREELEDLLEAKYMLNILEDLGIESTEMYQDAGWYVPSIHEIEEKINQMEVK